MPGYRTGNFKVEIEGTGELSIRVRALNRQKSHEMRNIAEEAARRAVVIMKAYAPKGKTGGLERRIDSGRALFVPGGAGGGGTWVAIAGVRNDGDPYPTNVFQGTGIFGPERRPIRAAPGSVIAIPPGIFKDRDMEKGFPLRKPKGIGGIVTKTIKGQRPQRDWVEAGQGAAERHVAMRLSDFLRDPANNPMNF